MYVGSTNHGADGYRSIERARVALRSRAYRRFQRLEAFLVDPQYGLSRRRVDSTGGGDLDALLRGSGGRKSECIERN